MSSMLGIDSYTQGKATKEAAKEASKASMYAATMQQKQYEQTRADTAPWREAGGQAVNTLLGKVQAGPGEYQQSPYYNFLMEQGANALERGASATGMQGSGAESKALVGYGQNLASTDYNSWLDNWYKSLTPWQSLAGLGSNTSIATGQMGANAAANAGNFMNQAGQYRAAGILGQGNTMANSMGYMSNPQNIMNTVNSVNSLGKGLGLWGGGGADVAVNSAGWAPDMINSMVWL